MAEGPAVAVTVELALWDAEVCEMAAALSLGELLAPAPWLRRHAERRGWTAELGVGAMDWRGMRQQFEGRPRFHSAWLAMGDKSPALAGRILGVGKRPFFFRCSNACGAASSPAIAHSCASRGRLAIGR